MKSFFRTISLFLIAALFSACGSKAVVPLADFITDVDKGEIVAVQTGGTLHLDLVSISNDKKTWYIDGELPETLKQIKEPNYKAFQNDYVEGELVTWEFRAVKVGVHELKLVYKGKDESTPAKTFNVTVDVQKAVNIFKTKPKSKEVKEEQKNKES